jgi:glycosyltransferase involved in cell wall biosynthesis
MRDVMLSIILPAMNEEKRIHRSLETYTRNFKDIEIIVIVNGSTDKTYSVVNEFAKKHKKIRLFEYSKPLGKGGAVLKGLEEARGDIIGFVDSDDAFGITGTRKLLNAIRDGTCECAIASKWRHSSFVRIPESAGRKLFSRAWNFLVVMLTGLPILDTQSGAKFFTRNAFENINKDFVGLGYEFDVELLYKFRKKGVKIQEIPLSVNYVKGSKFHAAYIPEMFVNLIKLFIKYRVLRSPL